MQVLILQTLNKVLIPRHDELIALFNYMKKISNRGATFQLVANIELSQYVGNQIFSDYIWLPSNFFLLLHMVDLTIYQVTIVCCVFRLVKGCSARRSLVKINFLKAFSCFSGKKEKKRVINIKLTEARTKKNSLKGGLPAYNFISTITHFLLFLPEKQEKALRTLISTSEWHAEHPFAGRNTQKL